MGYSDQRSLETERKMFTHFVQPWLAAAAWKAMRTTSTMRWEVNTLPPQTAAVRDGAKSDFVGILTEWERKFIVGEAECVSTLMNSLSRGTRHPALSGISRSNIARMQYITAEWTTEIGALRFPRTSHPVPSKSRTAEPLATSISTLS